MCLVAAVLDSLVYSLYYTLKQTATVSSLSCILSFPVYIEMFAFQPQHSHSDLLNVTHLSIFSPVPRRLPGFSLFKLTYLLVFLLQCFFLTLLIVLITLCFVPKLLRDEFALPQMENCWFNHLLSHDSTYPILCKQDTFINHVIKLNPHETRKKSLQHQQCILVFLEVKTDQNVNIYNLVQNRKNVKAMVKHLSQDQNTLL